MQTVNRFDLVDVKRLAPPEKVCVGELQAGSKDYQHRIVGAVRAETIRAVQRGTLSAISASRSEYV